MKLRSIPPRTMCKRPPVRGSVRRVRGTTPWHPHVLPHAAPTTTLQQARRVHLRQQCDAHIAYLTEEITQWLEEFGEEALMTLYEQRARLAELRAIL